MAAPAHIARENGKKGGRPKGSKSKATLEKEAVLAALRQRILKKMEPIFEAQFSLVRGVAYMYRIEEHKGGRKEHVLVTDPNEIGRVLEKIHVGEAGTVDEKYYYITVKAPDNRAIDSMLDRVFGKSTQAISGPDGGPIALKGVSITVRK